MNHYYEVFFNRLYIKYTYIVPAIICFFQLDCETLSPAKAKQSWGLGKSYKAQPLLYSLSTLYCLLSTLARKPFTPSTSLYTTKNKFYCNPTSLLLFCTWLHQILPFSTLYFNPNQTQPMGCAQNSTSERNFW